MMRRGMCSIPIHHPEGLSTNQVSTLVFPKTIPAKVKTLSAARLTVGLKRVSTARITGVIMQ
jgi:hypothetical protein